MLTCSAPFAYLRLLRVLSLILLAPWPALAEEAPQPTLEEAFTRKIENQPREQFLTLTHENDMLGGAGTDQNYTSGVRLTWFDTGAKPPLAAEYLDKLIPTFTINDSTSVYYSIGQNLYTPGDITTRTPDPHDRPYAGFLYVSAGLASITDNHIDDIEFTLGMVGPSALGEPTQKLIHNLIDSDNPRGWDHQLKDEPGIMVSWRRIWPEALSADLGELHFRTSPYGGVTLGNIYTYASTGVIFQLLPETDKWQSAPLRVRPAMPGSGYFSVPEGEFSWSLFAGLEGRLMGHNIFLDGNTFRDSPSVGKKYLVGDANLGLAFTYGRVQVSYTVNWRSLEFEGQDQSDVFGAVGLGYRF